MEKEKRKGQPKRGFLKFVIALLLIVFVCSVISVAVIWFGVGTKSYFARFGIPEEVVDFLYDNLEDGVSTPDDVLVFMHPYDKNCRHFTLSAGSIDSVRKRDFDSKITCFPHVFSALREGGSYYFYIEFYFNENNTLGHIDAEWSFSGL